MPSAVTSIIKSILILCAVSGLVATCAYPWTKHFWNVFGLATVAQFIIFWLHRSWLMYKVRKDAEEFDLRQMELMMSQATQVTCAYCKQSELVPLLVGTEENSYRCTSCGKENKVLIDITAVQVTASVNPKLDEEIKVLQEENGR